jgi:2-amino-4-hydroxy-6-hydroxymethyldihydropteridine diphosphokinase
MLFEENRSVDDKIHVRDLLLRGIIGINPKERQKRQDVVLNYTLYTDLRPAGRSDDIADAVNYRTVTKAVIHLVEQARFFLVETLAAEVARLCLDPPGVRAVTVQVEKPGALRFARSVSVEIHRTQADLANDPHRAYLTLGSNIEPEQRLSAAVRRLSELGTLLSVSPVYRTAPVGTPDQPDFLNAAALLETRLSPQALKQRLLQLEADLGRERTDDPNAPRTIDVDLALFDRRVMTTETVRLPHPDVQKYAHAALPLADLAPRYHHPETDLTLSDIVQTLSTEGIQRTDIVL